MITTAFVVADIAPRTEKEGEGGSDRCFAAKEEDAGNGARRNEDGAIQI